MNRTDAMCAARVAAEPSSRVSRTATATTSSDTGPSSGVVSRAPAASLRSSAATLLIVRDVAPLHGAPAQAIDDPTQVDELLDPSPRAARRPLMWCVDSGDLRAMTTFQVWVAVANGDIRPDARVWREGMECWVPLRLLPELACALSESTEPYVSRDLDDAAPDSGERDTLILARAPEIQRTVPLPGRALGARDDSAADAVSPPPFSTVTPAMPELIGTFEEVDGENAVFGVARPPLAWPDDPRETCRDGLDELRLLPSRVRRRSRALALATAVVCAGAAAAALTARTGAVIARPMRPSGAVAKLGLASIRLAALRPPLADEARPAATGRDASNDDRAARPIARRTREAGQKRQRAGTSTK